MGVASELTRLRVLGLRVFLGRSQVWGDRAWGVCRAANRREGGGESRWHRERLQGLHVGRQRESGVVRVCGNADRRAKA